ncbi:EAL domain-containing protein [Porticoccus sp. W117]|uniref:sensor domain-containing phosphodiesterase n=1 Tax=Porticoccus sp. W117 TaxID=3054777 RepID=UPI0025946430|nr:EAL domain-containing protein [Porticoccus sp. W117]MDM3870941.1 EAL domain-containing protein [Porticoccus sp. W117]
MDDIKLSGINWNLTEDSNFLATTATRLAQSLSADHVLIGELGTDGHTCSTLAYVVSGEPVDNIVYDLKDTPCADVYCGEVCLINGDVQQQYPKDALLVDLGVTSYTGVPLIDSEGKVVGILSALFANSLPLGSEENIRALFMMAAELIASHLEHIKKRQQLLLADTIIETIGEGIALCDRNRHIILTNPAFSRITGYSADELIGKHTSILRSDYHSEEFYEDIWHTSAREGRWSGEVWGVNKKGDLFPAWQTNNPIKSSQGSIEYYAILISDISERKAAEQKIRFQANYDPVTQLPNRHLLLSRLNDAIQMSKRHLKHCAVLFLDLDMFKTINDSLGHQAGDQLLQLVAKRLTEGLRESDTVARLGGDEFTIIVNDMESAQDAEVIADKLLQQLAQPFQLDHHPVTITGSIGIAAYPQDGDNPDKLLSYADQAMYNAKNRGKNCFSFFTATMQQQAERRLVLKHQLEEAIAAKDIGVAYQPIINIENGQIEKFEALARWQHQGKFISPVEFIPVAEEFGMIPRIGEIILEKSCELLRQLQRAGFTNLQFAINRSAKEFPRSGEAEPNWLDVLEDHQLPASAICFEVTESILAPDNLDQKRYFNKLKNAGAQIAIDDFGTGYSSLSYLRKFPVDILKIDRSFIAEFTNREDDLTLVSTIIAMARSLNLKVVAEGVEDQEQLNKLMELGCNYAQGFYFSKPIEAEQVLPYLQKWAEQLNVAVG